MAWFLNGGKPYTGDRIAYDDPEIPDRPMPHCEWTGEEWHCGEWYDWQGLKAALRNTPLFAKALGTTNPNAFALLMSTFDASGENSAKIQDFAWAISAVRAGLAVDYSEAELEDFRGLLGTYGFPVFL